MSVCSGHFLSLGKPTGWLHWTSQMPSLPALGVAVSEPMQTEAWERMKGEGSGRALLLPPNCHLHGTGPVAWLSDWHSPQTKGESGFLPSFPEVSDSWEEGWMVSFLALLHVSSSEEAPLRLPTCLCFQCAECLSFFGASS